MRMMACRNNVFARESGDMEWTDQVRNDWRSSAPSVPLSFPAAGVQFACMPKCFSSRSVGWFLSTKAEVEGVRCQITVSITCIGSRPTTALDPGARAEKMPELAQPAPTELLDAIADAAQEASKKAKGSRMPKKA